MAYSEIDKQEIWDSIFSEMMSGRSLKSILTDPGMPTRETIYKWLLKDKEKSDNYAMAIKIRADVIFDDILDIADSTDDDIITLQNGNKVKNNRVINRDRLRVDTRKWILARMDPKRYGDKLEINDKRLPQEAPTFNFKGLNDTEE